MVAVTDTAWPSIQALFSAAAMRDSTSSRSDASVPHASLKKAARDSGEKAQFYNARLLGIQLGQGIESIVDGDEVVRPSRGGVQGLIQNQRGGSSAAFCPKSSASVIDQNAPHDLRANGKKVGSVLP